MKISESESDECPLSGITSSGRVGRKGPESESDECPLSSSGRVGRKGPESESDECPLSSSGRAGRKGPESDAGYRLTEVRRAVEHRCCTHPEGCLTRMLPRWGDCRLSVLSWMCQMPD